MTDNLNYPSDPQPSLALLANEEDPYHDYSQGLEASRFQMDPLNSLPRPVPPPYMQQRHGEGPEFNDEGTYLV